MEKDTELQDSPQPDGTEEVTDDIQEEDTEEKSEESEIQKKNRQLYERAKKAEQKAKELELEMSTLKERADETDDVQEEGKINTQIEALTKELNSMKEKSELDEVLSKYPVLSDKYEEFDTYREEHQGMSLATAAKAYLVENDLLGDKPKRKGLEPARSGSRTAPQSGKMSSDDVKRLRENNFREYRKLLSEGKIQIAD